MPDLALDLSKEALGTEAYGDILLDASGAMQLTQGTEAIRQSLELRLRAASGDYFLATTEGLPWAQALSSSSPMSPALDASLKNAVLGTPGVLGIVNWDVSVSRRTRVATVTMEVEVVGGVIVFSLPATP